MNAAQHKIIYLLKNIMTFFVFVSVCVLLLFREGKGKRKRRREISICGSLLHTLKGDLAVIPDMCPRLGIKLATL